MSTDAHSVDMGLFSALNIRKAQMVFTRTWNC